MYKHILVPIDLADTDLAKPAIETAVSMARSSGGTVRLINVLPMTPVMLAAGSIARISPARSGKAASITRCWKKRRRSTPI